MEPYESTMSKGLQKLAADIIPYDEQLKAANEWAAKIIKLLQSKSKFDIGRVCLAGSTGKKTTIIDSDVDCVLFINGEQPPFKNVLDDFENILEMADSFGIKHVRSTKYSVQFKAMDFDFDILPATNFVVGYQLDGDGLIDLQQQRVLERIEQNPKKYGYMYSSSLAFSTVRFMQRQNGFVNEMVRIAKFWYKTLYFERYISGAKSLIELIAVYAANQEEKMPNISYLRCFQRFIGYLRDFERLNVQFDWKEHQILDKDRPRVIEPVNPYNNLAKNWDPKSIQLIKYYANETGRRLTVGVTRFDQLFEYQPVYRPDLREMLEHSPEKSHWLTSTTTSSSLFPDMKVRNERFHTDLKLWSGMQFLKTLFQVAICASKTSGDDVNQVKNVVQNAISKQISNTEWTWSTAVNEKHDDCDVTFTIPVANQQSVCISYRL